MVEKDNIVPVNHLKQAQTLIKKTLNLLDKAKTVHPYAKWVMNLEECVDELEDLLQEV